MNEKEMLKEYAEAKYLVESLEDQLKKANKRKTIAELNLINSLEAREATSTAKYPEIGMLSLSKPRVYANVLVQDRDNLHMYLREIGYDSLIKESVHCQSLAKFVSGKLEDGEDLPQFINYHLKQGVTFRKA